VLVILSVGVLAPLPVTDTLGDLLEEGEPVCVGELEVVIVDVLVAEEDLDPVSVMINVVVEVELWETLMDSLGDPVRVLVRLCVFVDDAEVVRVCVELLEEVPVTLAESVVLTDRVAVPLTEADLVGRGDLDALAVDVPLTETVCAALELGDPLEVREPLLEAEPEEEVVELRLCVDDLVCVPDGVTVLEDVDEPEVDRVFELVLDAVDVTVPPGLIEDVRVLVRLPEELLAAEKEAESVLKLEFTAEADGLLEVLLDLAAVPEPVPVTEGERVAGMLLDAVVEPV
jgi:hypothetical protein